VARTYQLIDTSFLYALYNRSDNQHNETLTFAQSSGGTPLVSAVILPEVCYLFLRDTGHHGMVQFIQAFATSGTAIVNVINDDLKRSGEIAASYRDAKFYFVDCSLMAIAERLNIEGICTFDRRDFAIFRLKHCENFRLLPTAGEL
jgi:predicted nucleic acid-binding protein